MSATPHIIIIGAGLLGLSSADSLIRRGVRVTVIDAAGGPGEGASFCNSGMVHPSQCRPWVKAFNALQAAEAVLDLAERSRHQVQIRWRQLGLSPWSETGGAIQLHDSQYLGEAALKAYTRMSVRAERYQGQWDFGRLGLLFPDDGFGNAYTSCQALADDLKASGCLFEFGRTIENVQALQADHIVVACGAASLDVLGDPIGPRIIEPQTGYALNFSRPDLDLPERPIMHAPSRSALSVFSDHVRLSGTVNETGPEALIEIWGDIAPDIVSRLGAPLSSWKGERPASKLGRPIIGRTPIPGVWINSGHGHMGWTLCTASGELIAEMILEGRADPRFAWPHPEDIDLSGFPLPAS